MLPNIVGRFIKHPSVTFIFKGLDSAFQISCQHTKEQLNCSQEQERTQIVGLGKAQSFQNVIPVENFRKQKFPYTRIVIVRWHFQQLKPSYGRQKLPKHMIGLSVYKITTYAGIASVVFVGLWVKRENAKTPLYQQAYDFHVIHSKCNFTFVISQVTTHRNGKMIIEWTQLLIRRFLPCGPSSTILPIEMGPIFRIHTSLLYTRCDVDTYQ